MRNKRMSSNANGIMYYVSALVAIIGATSYQVIVKKVPSDLNPLVSMIGIYVMVLPVCLILLLILGRGLDLGAEIHKLSWRQPALAVGVIMMEIGYLLMYRNGWTLSTGNLVTGAIINILLVFADVFVMGAKLNAKTVAGIALCLLGVGLLNAP
jgi:drug/metabolite transporter (DMT)-like permease